MRTEKGDGRCYAFKRKTGSACYRAEYARREKRCYMPTNETHAPVATGMVKWSVVPPIFCAETKDSKTNCSATSMSLQHCFELLSCGICIKLSRTSAGLCHIGCVSFLFCLQQFMARCLVPKTPHGRVDKVKNYDCHQSQNLPIAACIASIDP